MNLQFELRCFGARVRDTVPHWIAFHLPRAVAYWCAIRVSAYATCGKWGNDSPTELLAMTALKRWEEQ